MFETYYADRHVRDRLIEFLGGSTSAEATCIYIVDSAAPPQNGFAPLPPSAVDGCLGEGRELARSLWDRRWLVAHLDIDYANFDFPAEPYLDPERTFDLLAPTVACLKQTLLGFGIAPLDLLSGRGHHLVWQVARGGPALARLASLGRVGATLEGVNLAPRPPRGEPVGHQLGAAFAGLGQVAEYLAHRTLEALGGRSAGLPLQVTEVRTAEPHRGRELVCLDLSEYGDPLHMRIVRAAFSAYLKPAANRWLLGEAVVDRLPPMFVIPLAGMDHCEGWRLMRDPQRVLALAETASARIPDQSEGTLRLADAYRRSDVAGFHDWFYQQEHEPPARWPATYDRMPLEALPSCARRLLVAPNEALLKPAAIRHLVRVMLALGWHPRHIAGLIRSKYERDYGWGAQFLQYDAATRADFYVRLFAGLVATGRDELADFDCRSVRLQGLCCDETCGERLETLRRSLLARRSHDRLACRPFNGPFLPDEDR